MLAIEQRLEAMGFDRKCGRAYDNYTAVAVTASNNAVPYGVADITAQIKNNGCGGGNGSYRGRRQKKQYPLSANINLTRCGAILKFAVRRFQRQHNKLRLYIKGIDG